MKIIQVVSSLDTGGIRSVIMGLCNELVKENDVYIGVYKGKEVDVSHLFDTRIHILYFSSIKEFITIIRKYNVEIAHFHMSLKSGVFAFVTKCFTKAKTVCHSHTSQDFRQGKVYSLLYKPLSKFLISIFSNSKIACSELAGRYLFNENYIILPNAVDNSLFVYNSKYRTEIRSLYNLNYFTYGFVGHIHEVKNLEFLCKVLNDVNKIHSIELLIVGDYTEDESLKHKLLQYDFVKITGMVNVAYKYYSAFDCLVLPSLFEGMPMVAIEAQCNGLDVYLSDTITRLVNVNNKCHYIKLNSHDEWFKTLSNVYNKHRSYENACVNTSFDMGKYSADMIAIYQGILS